jgi:rhodanese-related sulfurtransferase
MNSLHDYTIQIKVISLKGRAMKTAKDYLTEANSVVERISPNEGIERYNKGNLVVVDVRDSSAFPETGTVQGALRIPRGLIEFVADDTHPMHNGALKKDAQIGIICAVGGQAALTAKTMKDMGFEDVVNLGGVSDWAEAGGPMED